MNRNYKLYFEDILTSVDKIQKADDFEILIIEIFNDKELTKN